MQSPSPLVSPESLRDGGVPNAILIDARSGPDAKDRFEAGHLAGARHVDLDRDLAAAGADAARGGRHPLPAPEAFAEVLTRLGIAPEMPVVVYDDQAGANAAARFWWMLRAAGHDAVFVLDGGLSAAIAAGVPTEAGAEKAAAPSASVSVKPWDRPMARLEEVSEAAADPSRLVIDVRDPSRYRGEHDPFDPVPGHLPGAINVPYASNLGPDRRFLPRDALAAKYRAVFAGRSPADVIVHCGSGVTACHTLLALEHAGLSGAKLYVGSFSEWSRRGLPIAKGPEPR